MISALETFLASNMGVDQVTVDGQSIKYNRSQAMTELTYWRQQAAKEGNAKPLVRPISLNNTW